MSSRLLASLCALALAVPLLAQGPARIAIRAGRLIDGKSDQPMANAVIVIEHDRIVSVTPGGTPPAGATVIACGSKRSAEET